MASSSVTRSASTGALLLGDQQDYGGNDDSTNSSEVHRTSSPGRTDIWKWLPAKASFHENKQPLQQLFVPPGEDPTPTTGKAATASSPPTRRYEAVRPRYLQHLETLMPQYCRHLAHPTYQEASNAMSLLLNNTPPLPTSDSGEPTMEFPPGSPERPSRGRGRDRRDAKTTVTKEMNRLLSSPFRSRKKKRAKQQDAGASSEKAFAGRWSSTLSSSRSTLSADHSHHGIQPTMSFPQKLDAVSWYDFVAPLILLAGAEAIYADLEHVHPNPTTIPWLGLYQRVESELRARLPEEPPSTAQQPPQPTTEASSGNTEPTSPGVTPPASPPKTKSASSSLLFGPMGGLLPPSTGGGGGGLIPPSTPKKTNRTTPNDENKPHYPKIRALGSWLDTKIQWLPFHESLYLTWSYQNLVFLRAFAAALPSLADIHGSDRLLQAALQHEIQATLALMEMGVSLERGRFLETICMARKVKQLLMAVPEKDTALLLWMTTTFQDYLSIMAVVFDKIHTFATPLYGFDLQILLEATQGERTMLSDKKGVVDLDSLVMDFLRCQDKAGGTAMAVTIVLDTEGVDDDDENQASTPAASNQPSHRSNAGEITHQSRHHHHHHRVELGFAIHDAAKQNPGGTLSSNKALASQPPPRQPGVGGSKTNNIGPSEGDEKSSEPPRCWPAIYLRSTMRLGTQPRGIAAANAGLGLISGMRRNAGSGINLDGSSSAHHIHHGSGLFSSSHDRASVDGMSPRSKFRKSGSSNRMTMSHRNIFEYETEPSTRPSWPHSEWQELRAFLDSMNKGTATANIVTDHGPPSSPTASPHRRGDPHLSPGTTFEEPLAVSLQPNGMQSEETRQNASSSASPGLFVSSSSIFPSEKMPRWDPLPTPSTVSSVRSASSSVENGNTTFHAVHLSDYMWMIVMVKGEGESRWHRRKSRGIPDTEIRAFLNGMASKLRVSSRFVGLKTCQTARVKVKDPLAPRVRGRDLGLREAQWKGASPEDSDNLQDEILELMKEAFSVSGTTAMNRAESILTTMSGGFRPTTGSRSPRDRRRVLALEKRSGPFAQNSDYREGAALLFLGPELFRQFLESTNE